METLTYTAAKIKKIKKGIVAGEPVTPEQEQLLQHFEILIPEVEGDIRVLYVNRKLDVLIKRLDPKKK